MYNKSKLHINLYNKSIPNQKPTTKSQHLDIGQQSFTACCPTCYL